MVPRPPRHKVLKNEVEYECNEDSMSFTSMDNVMFIREELQAAY